MKQLYLIIILLLSLSTTTFPQPIVHFEFKETQPKWLHYSYSRNLPRFLQLYEQEGKPLLINNDIYLLHNISNNRDEGYLIEKIDVETGITKWEDSYYDTKYNTRRYATPLTQKEDKIEMYYFQEWSKVQPFIFWQDSRFRRIDYYADSGKKCDSLITDLNDSLNTNLQMPYLIINPFTYRSDIFTYKNKVKYIKQQGAYENVTKQSYASFQVLTLDSLGHKIDSHHIRVDTKYAVRNIELRKYGEGKYVCLILATGDSNNPTSTSSKEVKLLYLKEDLSVEKIIDISLLMPNMYNFCHFSYLDKNYFLLNTTTDVKKNGVALTKVSSILLNPSGKLIESIGFDNYEINTNDAEDYTMTFIPKKKQTILINMRGKSTDKTINMEVLASNDKGGYNLLKTLPIKDSGSMGIYDATVIGDSSLLCRYKYVDLVSMTDYKVDVKWSVWALFPFSSLGFSTSTKEITADNSVNYYPNPTHDILNINSKEEFNEIKVYSIEGRLIQQQTNSDNTLNTDALLSGIYFFELWQGDRIVSHKLKFVKIK